MSQELPEWVMGATTIGLVCKDGVVLASEKRVSLGYLVISKTGRKVFTITDRIGAACAGLTSDFQILIRLVRASVNLYELDMKKPITAKAAAKLMSNILFQRKWVPLITDTIVAGFNGDAPHLYTLDLVGSLIDEKFAAVGTGARVAIGVLEARYNEEISVEEGKKLALDSIKSASERDIASGEGVDILVIKKDGFEESYFPLK
ncbi:MAG: archaeal proteasome endopeptidase complex subunit beta [Candidatus Odinarchaeia archaeon]